MTRRQNLDDGGSVVIALTEMNPENLNNPKKNNHHRDIETTINISPATQVTTPKTTAGPYSQRIKSSTQQLTTQPPIPNENGNRARSLNSSDSTPSSQSLNSQPFSVDLINQCYKKFIDTEIDNIDKRLGKHPAQHNNRKSERVKELEEKKSFLESFKQHAAAPLTNKNELLLRFTSKEDAEKFLQQLMETHPTMAFTVTRTVDGQQQHRHYNGDGTKQLCEGLPQRTDSFETDPAASPPRLSSNNMFGTQHRDQGYGSNEGIEETNHQTEQPSAL